MDYLKFSCTITPSNTTTPPLDVWFTLNGKQAFPLTQINETTVVSMLVPDEEDKEWLLEIHVSGKTNEHVVVDKTGNIVSDTYLTFNNFNFDGIDIDTILLSNPWPYKHNFNGTGEDTVDEFYDVVGCNGTIQFKFATPFYLWLLENM